MRDVAPPWRTLAPAWPRPSRPWFGAAAFPSPEGPQRYPLRCSTRTAAAELTHWLDAFIRHLRVQTLPMATPVWFDSPRRNPVLVSSARAPLKGLQGRAQPGALRPQVVEGRRCLVKF